MGKTRTVILKNKTAMLKLYIKKVQELQGLSQDLASKSAELAANHKPFSQLLANQNKELLLQLSERAAAALSTLEQFVDIRSQEEEEELIKHSKPKQKKEEIEIVAINEEVMEESDGKSSQGDFESSVEDEDEFDSTDDEGEVVFDDVTPVYGEEAIALNQVVIERIQEALNNDDERISSFKTKARQFGTGEIEAPVFYDYLSQEMSQTLISDFILDFAKLLAVDERRLPLLKCHHASLQKEVKKQEKHRLSLKRIEANQIKQFQQHQQHHSLKINTNANSSTRSRSGSSSSNVTLSSAKAENDFPPDLRLETINHLVFVIHGIGQHDDFQDQYKSWDGKSGLEGGNYAFREVFRNLLETTFSEIPLVLEMQSIEWHEELHVPTGVDNVFDMVCPEGSSGLREFTKETLMDIMYYASPGFGQIIINTVTDQLNSKYSVFMEEHPGWDGEISIFAHSLGSVISYDILSHGPNNPVSRNGVTFPGLLFHAKNFFAAGSPVPVMLLSRGDLNIKNGTFEPSPNSGLIPQGCDRYFNLFHPIDPIAYRVEPLLKPDMRAQPPVQLISSNYIRNHDCDFIKIHELWEAITAPTHGIHRIDYALKRRKREGMMELAYAAASHSSYWESEEVVLFTLYQMCRPVVNKLQHYMSARKPLPTLSHYNSSLITKHKTSPGSSSSQSSSHSNQKNGLTPRRAGLISPCGVVFGAGTILLNEKCTGFWNEQTILVSPTEVMYMKSREEVLVKEHHHIQMLSQKTTVIISSEEPDFGFEIRTPVPSSENSNLEEEQSESSKTPSILRRFSSSSNSSRNIRNEDDEDEEIQEILIYLFRAPTTRIRNEWMQAIQRVVNNLSKKDKQNSRNHICNTLNLHGNYTVDYFGAMKTGELSEKTSSKHWLRGTWASRWCVLHADGLFSVCESSPSLTVVSRLCLAHQKLLHTYRVGLLFRLISARGTTTEFRVQSNDDFAIWLKVFKQLKDLKLIEKNEVIANSPASIACLNRMSNSSITMTKESLRIRVTGHQIRLDNKGAQYAAYVFNVNGGSANGIILRRFNEIRSFHHKLRQIFPHDQIPALPATRIWNKLDPTYLKEKSVHINGYMQLIAKLCHENRGEKILLDFLNDE